MKFSLMLFFVANVCLAGSIDSEVDFINALAKTKLTDIKYQGIHVQRKFDGDGQVKLLTIKDTSGQKTFKSIWEKKTAEHTVYSTYLDDKPYAMSERFYLLTAPLKTVEYSDSDFRGQWKQKVEYHYLPHKVEVKTFEKKGEQYSLKETRDYSRYVFSLRDTIPSCDEGLMQRNFDCMESIRGFYSLRWSEFLSAFESLTQVRCISANDEIQTGMGFRVDGNTCNTPQMVQSITESLEQMYTDNNLRCILHINPNLFHHLITTIHTRRPIIYCAGSNMTDDEFNRFECRDRGLTPECLQGARRVRTLAGAYNTPGTANLTLVGHSPPTDRVMSSTQQTVLSGALMHEVMHIAGMCTDANIHNDGRFDDSVFGCGALCNESNPQWITKEGCEECLNAFNTSPRVSPSLCNKIPTSSSRTEYFRYYGLGIGIESCLMAGASRAPGDTAIPEVCAPLLTNPVLIRTCGSNININQEFEEASCFTRVRQVVTRKLSFVMEDYYEQRGTTPDQREEHLEEFLHFAEGSYRLPSTLAARRQLAFTFRENENFSQFLYYSRYFLNME